MIRTFLLIGIISLLAFSILADTGHEGGGGDAEELRVNDIRADILQWIKEGGAKNLAFPANINYEKYKLLFIKSTKTNLTTKNSPLTTNN